jgi:hypothetical protein
MREEIKKFLEFNENENTRKKGRWRLEGGSRK